jgi:hypothetical protein
LRQLSNKANFKAWAFFLSRTKAIYLEPNLSETILFETEAMQAFLHRIKAIYLELKLFYLELNLSEGFSI